MKHLLLVSHPAQSAQEEQILKLAGWMGVPTKKLTIEEEAASALQTLRQLDRSECCVAVSAETLAFLLNVVPAASLQDFVENHRAEMLVFSCGRSSHHENLLSWLTNGAVGRLSSPEEKSDFSLPHSGKEFSGQFAGLSFSLRRAVSVPAYELRDTNRSGIQEIMLADKSPVFLRARRASCDLFLLAVAQIPDIDERLSPDKGIEEYYDQVIPLLLFLRHCFGASCWRGPESTARFIIDDPLLNQTYGFLDFGALGSSMRSAGYGTSIAFIPWNHWRTSKKKAARILDQGANLSICVHGCDHINKEFDVVDPETLQWKAGTALRRMERHERRTGVPFERVMVFPQGRFSTPAVLALRTNDYLAAVNTTCFPTNDGAEPLTISDFLRPAVTRFHGFPIFQRRYPRRLIDSAFDIFLGRPVLLVQHHEYFRDGYQQWEEFVNGLHKLEPALAWTTLSSQLMRSCLMRSVSEDSMEVRFFTRKFKWKNPRATPTRCLLTRHETDASAIAAVRVDGKSVPFSIQGDLLLLELQLGPGQLIEMEIMDRPRPHAPVHSRPGMTHTVGVSVRRVLSEFRDKTLARHPRLMQAATKVARKMKATGDSVKEEPL